MFGLLLKSRVVRVAARTTAIEGGPVGFVERGTLPEALDEIGVRQRPPADRNDVGQSRLDIGGDRLARTIDPIDQQRVRPEPATIPPPRVVSAMGKMDIGAVERSEERRGGNECVGTCRYRWSPDH